MRSRLMHIILILLGGAGVVLAYLEKSPKWSGLAGAGLLLVAELRKALAPVSEETKMRLLFAAFFVAVGTHLLYGCATLRKTTPVVKSCEPSTDQEMAILEAAAKPSQAEALAAIDALGFVLCVLQRGADEAIAALAAKPETASIAATMNGWSPVLDNLRAWRAAHP